MSCTSTSVPAVRAPKSVPPLARHLELCGARYRASPGHPRPIPVPLRRCLPAEGRPSGPVFPRVAHPCLAQSPDAWASQGRASRAPGSPRGPAVPPRARRCFPAGPPRSARDSRGRPERGGRRPLPPGLHLGAVFAFVSLPEERVHRGARRGRRTEGERRAQASGRRRRTAECGAAAAPGNYSRGAGRAPAAGPRVAPGEGGAHLPGAGPPGPLGVRPGPCARERGAGRGRGRGQRPGGTPPLPVARRPGRGAQRVPPQLARRAPG